MAITTKAAKQEAAIELGADSVLISEDEDAMAAQEVTFDFILVTIPESFDVNPYVCLLKPHGRLVTVGLLGPYEKPLNNMEAAKYERSIGGSLIGGIRETQEVLDFCAEHNILPTIQLINIEDINDAFDKIKSEDVQFRYVIDMQSMKG